MIMAWESQCMPGRRKECCHPCHTSMDICHADKDIHATGQQQGVSGSTVANFFYYFIKERQDTQSNQHQVFSS